MSFFRKKQGESAEMLLTVFNDKWMKVKVILVKHAARDSNMEVEPAPGYFLAPKYQ